MALLKAKRLVTIAAKNRVSMQENISKKEIKEKINQIKYLSSQKNVPKLNLRKEIIHLEHKLERVFEVERKLLKQEKRETTKVSSLKKQIIELREQLSNAKDEELREKVSKLSHLLGDLLAKSSSEKDIQLSQKILSTLNDVDKKKHQLEEEESDNVVRTEMIIKRFKIIKHELEINKKLEKGNPDLVKKLDESIAKIQEKLEQFRSKNPFLFDKIGSEKVKVKHSVLFTPSEESPKQESNASLTPLDNFSQQKIEIVGNQGVIDKEVLEELPLPPPPKIIGKKR